ncbi:MAG: hypothetical protein KDD44_14955, partial [Bdellovibrionales bacterium]|nr:hypothetical protein [Bdellovibrionales bacterium]
TIPAALSHGDGGFSIKNETSGAFSSFAATPGVRPLTGDFDGDGKQDIAAVWQLGRLWTVKNGDNQLLFSAPWGVPGDTPLGCDLDGDGASDRVIVRLESNNLYTWHIALATGPVLSYSFGSIGDRPSCDKDFTGDGLPDLAVFRPSTGHWFLRDSSTGSTSQFSFGLAGDVPL